MRLKMGTLILAAGVTVLFQNCEKARFHSVQEFGSVIGLAVPCGTQSCSLTPLTSKPAVTTILLALGDESNSQLVGNPVSNQYLAESVVRVSTPAQSPKILIVKAHNHNGEDPEDTLYIQSLLSGYQTTVVAEPAGGLLPEAVQGYDLIWFNNPGHPFSSQISYDTLMAFEGGVVLQGDDLARSDTFSMTPLTGLTYIDNGTSVTCGNQTFPHDNNAGEQFRVSLNPEIIQGVDQATVSFRYGNDIDNTVIADPAVVTLAVAKGGPSVCTEPRPAVVLRQKP
jgi:hypothetical protein